jgi:hypothetical protein
MLRFQVTIFGSTGGTPLATSFDLAAAALDRLPRMFVEPDGSFVWSGEGADGQRWQVDGNLIDRGDALACVELNGHCPEERFDELLRCFDWPAAPLAFALTRQGVALDEVAFRERARKAGA